MDYRLAMLNHLEAFGRAVTGTDLKAPWPGFLAQRATLAAADEWLRALDPPPDPVLATKFGMMVTALLLAVDDVLRLFPDDPADHPAPKRYGMLTGTLLPEMRSLLEVPGKLLQ